MATRGVSDLSMSLFVVELRPLPTKGRHWPARLSVKGAFRTLSFSFYLDQRCIDMSSQLDRLVKSLHLRGMRRHLRSFNELSPWSHASIGVRVSSEVKDIRVTPRLAFRSGRDCLERCGR